MFVQKGILQYNQASESLFLRNNDYGFSFDTFFNSLNIYLVKKYVGANHVRLIMNIEGNAHVFVAYSFKNKITYLDAVETSKGVFEFDIGSFPSKGIVFPIIKGDKKEFNIHDFRYEIDCPNRQITPCVLITTFNRQEFLTPNLEKLNKCEGLSHVIVVDNARNIELPKNLDPKKFTLVPNDNLGGTGGFTRGMMEARKRGFSHIFIMDDDITLIPEVMEKTFSLVSSLKDEHQNDWIGYSMLINDDPLVQYELGTKWNGYRMVLNNHKLNVGKYKSLNKNQINKKYNYSAWWSLMMPTSVIDKYSYPFPFFIKFDDIEYALRRENEEIVLTNGFGVWHESFDKKFNPYLEYYLMRNAFVTNAIHRKSGAFVSAYRYLRKSVKFYFVGKHIEFKLINLGVDDFFKGPDFFKEVDIEANNNKVREIAKEKPLFIKGLFTIPFVACFRFFQILFRFNKAKRQYINSYKELTSESFWSKVFNHE